MYITPGLLSSADWDVLAESARWSRSNAAILRDTHWVGGDPGRDEAYGWASWSEKKGILVLRNPSSKPQSMSVDVQKSFELPAGAAHHFQGHTPWASDKKSPSVALVAHVPHTFLLQCFEVLTLDAEPER